MYPKYLFGKDFTYKLYTHEDGTLISDLPAQTVTAYIFTTRPTRAVAAAGTGATASASATIAQGQELAIDFTAISDPDTNTDAPVYVWYIAVNFVLKSAGQTQTVVREIVFTRVSGHDSTTGITLEDVTAVWPDVLQYVSTEQVQANIALARAEILSDLRNKGIAWAQVYEPNELRQAHLYNTMVYVYGGQGEDFVLLRDKMEASYEATMRALRLSYDVFASGQKTDRISSQGMLRVLR